MAFGRRPPTEWNSAKWPERHLTQWHSEWHSTKFHSAEWPEWHFTEWHSTECTWPNDINSMVLARIQPAEWHSAEWHSAEWHSAEWHSAECTWLNAIYSMALGRIPPAEWHTVEWQPQNGTQQNALGRMKFTVWHSAESRQQNDTKKKTCQGLFRPLLCYSAECRSGECRCTIKSQRQQFEQTLIQDHFQRYFFPSLEGKFWSVLFDRWQKIEIMWPNKIKPLLFQCTS